MPNHASSQQDYSDGRAAIAELANAELRATQVIATAKQRKNELMKRAREEASEEAKRLKELYEITYEKTSKNVQSNEIELANRIKGDHKTAIRGLEKSYKDNFRHTLVYVLNEVLQSSLPEVHQNISYLNQK